MLFKIGTIFLVIGFLLCVVAIFYGLFVMSRGDYADKQVEMLGNFAIGAWGSIVTGIGFCGLPYLISYLKE